MTTDARARRQMSEGLALISDGIQKVRLAVEIERTLRDSSEPDGDGVTPVRLSPCARGDTMRPRKDVQ